MDHKQQHATFGTLKERQWSTIYNQSAPVVLREVPTYTHDTHTERERERCIYIYIHTYIYIFTYIIL